jgi:U3 small nucleolar RNA-associated protein 23
MRAKRSKQYRKLMRQYELLGFRQPYQVLLDAQLIQDAAKCKLNLGKLIQGALGGAEIKPMITQCCIRHLYALPADTEAEKREKDAWIEVAKAAERRRCGHHELEKPLSTLDCLLSVVDPKGSGHNRHRYVVASQEQEVRVRMREIVGVPLVYLKRSVMILEPMAEATEQARDREERAKIRAGLKGGRGAQSGIKRKRDEEDLDGKSEPDLGAPAVKKSKVKGPKGPNPLSVKKSKKDSSKTPVAKDVEDRHAAVRKASTDDPQASEKALQPSTANGGIDMNGVLEEKRKRKRKRKQPEKEPLQTVAAVSSD